MKQMQDTGQVGQMSLKNKAFVRSNSSFFENIRLSTPSESKCCKDKGKMS